MKKNKIGERRIYDMWIIPVLGCNDEIRMDDGSTNTNYTGRPVGNSPEFMPLDNSLNNDIHQAAKAQVSATRFLPKDDPKRFSFATPETIKHAYGRIHCPRYDPRSAIPTNDRIAQDINKVFFCLLTVMEAEGKVVPGLASRKGHRMYINSLAIEKNTITIGCVEEFLNNGGDEDEDSEDENENEDQSQKSKEAKNDAKPKAKRNRWLHPDTCDVLRNRWKDEGTDRKEE